MVKNDHSYCKAPDDTADTSHESPGNFYEAPRTCRSKKSKLLKKDRLRTFRLRQKVQLLKKSMEKLTKASQSINELIKGAGEFLEEPALSFFASQLRNSSCRCKAKGRRWTYRDKIIALSLYHQSPRAY